MVVASLMNPLTRANGEIIETKPPTLVIILLEMIDLKRGLARTTDGRQIVLRRPPGSPNIETRWVEVTGSVRSDMSIVEKMSTPIHGEIDTDVWNKSVLLMNKYSDIF